VGFLGKFYVVAAGASTNVWGLLFVLVVTSTIGLFYYLRIVVALYATGDEPAAAPLSSHVGSRLVLTLLTVLLVWLGTYPLPLFETIRTIFVGLV